MSSLNFVGLNDDRSSSRVLRPPGGGSTNIFAPAEEAKPHSRPKYDQQNSSNLNFCMNTVDPNLKVQQQFAPEPAVQEAAPAPEPKEQSAPAAVQHVQPEAAQPSAALPNYHHHRSTALW